MAKELTSHLEKTLSFITSFIQQHAYPPTVREICEGVGVSSPSTAQYYLNKLEELGKIKKRNSKKRAIELVEKNDTTLSLVAEYVNIPLVGRVSAGVPILATENIEQSLPLPKIMFNNDYNSLFALNVVGESMINAGILNGDKIIIRKQPTASNGDIVVALIDDSVTVKRFYKEKDVIRLQPENDHMDPIIVKEVEIVGVVVELIRKF